MTPPGRLKRTYMFDFHRTFNNPFNDPNIAMDRLIGFTTDHLPKMTANNPGGFLTARIAATTTALSGVNTAFVTDTDKLGLRKAMKQLKDDYRAALPAGVAKINGLLTGQFGDNSTQATECFPSGRSIFSSCKDDVVGNHLQTMIDGVTKYQAQLGAGAVTAATALLTGWNAVYAPSETSGTAKDTSITAKNTARLALQLELFKNLLTIALQYPSQPEKLDLYMQQSLLETHPAAPPTPPPPPPPPAPTP